MKTRNLLTAGLIMLTLILSLPLDSMGQKKGKGGPPPWAPAHGYRAKTRHIYFPDQNFYFDIQRNVYIFPDGRRWLESAIIPPVFSGIDLRVVNKVELDLNTNSPQRYNADHISKYKVKSKAGKGKGSQGKVPPGQAKKGHPGKGKKK